MSSQYPQLTLPRPHLSWTQVSLWITNRERYKNEYFADGKKLDTKYLTFGKNIASLIEQGLHKTLLPDLETYDSPEFEMNFKVRGIVPVLAFIDTYDSKRNVFREYKTGKIAWTKAKVQKHDQLVLYATGLKWIGRGIPEYCDLDWIETIDVTEEAVDFWRDGEKKVDVTGRIVSFHREFDEREIERMEDIIVRVAWEISDAYQEYLTDL